MLELEFEDEAVVETVEETENTQSDIYGEILSNRDYHSTGAIGSTMLSVMIDNPVKFKMIKDGSIKFESLAFENGEILHTKVLEPEKCDDVYIVSDTKIPRNVKKILKDNLDYIVIPNQYLTPSGAISKKKDVFAEFSEWRDENSDKELVSMSDINVLEFLISNKDKIMIDSDREEKLEIAITNAKTYLPNFSKYFEDENGYSERSFFAIIYLDEDKENIPLTFKEVQELKDDDEILIDGVLCQCRPDRMYVPDNAMPNNIIVFDFKSTGKSATPKDWIKSSASFGYDLQEVHYRKVLEANGFIILDFCFAYCSLLEYGGAGYKGHIIEDLEGANDIHKKALRKLKWCKDNNTYSVQTFNGNGFDIIDKPPLPVWKQFVTV